MQESGAAERMQLLSLLLGAHGVTAPAPCHPLQLQVVVTVVVALPTVSKTNTKGSRTCPEQLGWWAGPVQQPVGLVCQQRHKSKLAWGF